VDTAPQYRDLVGDNLVPDHAGRSRQLAEALRREARRRGVPYAAAAEVTHPGEDGIHLDMASHSRLGELLASTIGEQVTRPRTA
jgi:lysophospholipase L1-like esterase